MKEEGEGVGGGGEVLGLHSRETDAGFGLCSSLSNECCALEKAARLSVESSSPCGQSEVERPPPPKQCCFGYRL